MIPSNTKCIEILVINLDHEKERMSFQNEQLNSLEVSFERLSAYQIDDQNNPLYQKHYKEWQRPLSLAEVACFLSHKDAWHRVIERDEPMLILEDDALLSNDIKCTLAAMSVLQNIDYVNLEARKQRKKLLSNHSLTSVCDSSLYRMYQGRSGAAGYVLWPSGATKLLQQMNMKGIAIVDKFINENYSLNAYQLEPANIIQLDQCKSYGFKSPLKVRSTIGARVKKAVPLKDQIRYRFKRFFCECQIGLNYLRNMHRASRRCVLVSKKFNVKEP